MNSGNFVGRVNRANCRQTQKGGLGLAVLQAAEGFAVAVAIGNQQQANEHRLLFCMRLELRRTAARDVVARRKD